MHKWLQSNRNDEIIAEDYPLRWQLPAIGTGARFIAYLSQWRRLHRHIGELLEPLVKLKFGAEAWKADSSGSDSVHMTDISERLDPVQCLLADLAVFVDTCSSVVRAEGLVTHVVGWQHCASAVMRCLGSEEPLDDRLRTAVLDALGRLYAWAFEAVNRLAKLLRDLDDLFERSCDPVENKQCPLRTLNRLPMLSKESGPN